MRKATILLTVLCISLLTFSQTDKRLKGVEKQLNSILETSKAPGFAVAVVEGDKIIYAKGFGYSDFENKVPADANTLYAIGSSTKAFTSSLLGLLREDKKLSFDDSPLKHVPELRFFNDEMNNTIIIKDLMRHTTGLPRHDAAWYYFPSQNKDSLVMRIAHQEPFTGVRQQWYYNNFGFLLQGVITERLTNKTWEENIEEKFFKPLEMNRSKTKISGMKSSSNAAFGYGLDSDRNIEKSDYYDIAGMSPAGSINSSVNDVSNWLITWINNGKFKGKQIIPEDYIQEAISSQAVVSSGKPSEKLPDIHFSNYGYGWFLKSYKGHYMVEHGGNINGFSASVGFYPSDKIGIVVLVNQDASAVPGLVRNTIADYILEVEKTPWADNYKEDLEKALKAQKEVMEDSELSNVKNTKPSHASVDYTGLYENKGYGKFEIILDNDSLVTTLNNEKLFLHHVHYDTFELVDYSEGKIDEDEFGKSLKVNFKINETGDVESLTASIEPTTDAIVFKRTPNTLDVDSETLGQYVGTYDLGGMEAKFYIKNENILYAFIKGQPEYELVPVAKNMFNLKILDGYKVEFVETEGKISGVKFIQPNGVFKAKRKDD
ncbi:serine hydrolase [Winogradskyella litorisediminis]|uniref:Serine hydrolase n=1 Tax=Winogradskyella litorisediminis TaxID=1156618 RepID=A0ABW3N664_9FLAO